MIRPPGIDNGAFVVSPETVWYARVLLLFSASATTDTGSKSFDCALVSTLETYDDPENGYYIYYIYYIYYLYYFDYLILMVIMAIIAIMLIIFVSQDGWNRLALKLYTSLTTGNQFFMSSQFRISWENSLLYQSVTKELFSTTSATSFRAPPATAGRVPVMDAGCGSSTRGHWGGPGICKKCKRVSGLDATWRKVPCDHAASPCLGHAPCCPVCPARIPVGSSGSAAVR